MSGGKKIAYEDKWREIDNEIRKRRPKWRLTSLAWMDFDDVSQIIRAHIAKKWHQWDQSRPLLPWINKIITNQFKNILRNYYHNFVKPCVSCPFNSSKGEEGDLCSFTKSGNQDDTCPLYKKWLKAKKYAYDVKMPVSMENLSSEISSIEVHNESLSHCIAKLNALMKENLSEKHFSIYSMLFIQNMSEEEIAKKLGYKTSEKGRKAGYKQIKNLKRQLKEKAIKLIQKNDIIF